MGGEGPEGLTEAAMVEALVALVEWEDGAREVKRQQEGVVRGLEGMGMGAAGGEAKAVVERVSGLMGEAVKVRWALEDCLVVMGDAGEW